MAHAENSRFQHTVINAEKTYFQTFSKIYMIKKTYALKQVKRFCKKFGFTAGRPKDSIAEGRKKQ